LSKTKNIPPKAVILIFDGEKSDEVRNTMIEHQMRKATTMEIVENEYYNGDWWLMQVRMVQPLNVKTK